MRTRPAALFVAALFAAISFSTQPSAQADTFGTSGNEFTIDFVNIGNAGNAANTTGFGAVPYEYRMGTYEVSQNAIDKATASGMANVTAGAWTGNQPAANISWLESAAFVNWLNTSKGHQAAYNLTPTGEPPEFPQWSMSLWSNADAWQLGGENLYRHKDAHYFLPSENEWYKAAYNIPPGWTYYSYATASSTAPTPVASGTSAGTAVGGAPASSPAGVDNAGGLSPYGTMGQSGNVYELNESAPDGANDSANEARTIRGGFWSSTEFQLSSWFRFDYQPTMEGSSVGFRVASVPEPSTYALLLMTGAGALWLARRRR